MSTTYNSNDRSQLYEDRKKQFYKVEDLMAIIKNNFNAIKNADYEYYGKYNFKIENEQYYVPDSERKEPNTIYIAVKFQKATIDYYQVVVPFIILAISEKNALDVCQRLLLEYSQTFTLTDGGGYSEDEEGNKLSFVYKQVYDAPSATSHFNEVYDGYRSTFVLTGNISINYGINPLKAIYYYPNYNESNDETGEALEIKTLGNGFSYSHTLDTQPYSGKNKTESVVKYGTLTITFETYQQDNAFFNKILLFALKHETRNVTGDNLEPIGGSLLINDSFYFGVVFNNQTTLNEIFSGNQNDETPFIVKFKLKDYQFGQPMGSFPTAKVVLTE